MVSNTEDEFLSWREHVKGERDFILVFFELEPADEGGHVGSPLSRVRLQVYGWHDCRWGGGRKEGSRRCAGVPRRTWEERLRIRANEWDVRSSNISKKDFTGWDAQKLRGATGMNVPG